MDLPLFSILIANYNNGRFFEECYKSIVKQDYQNWEVIILDDASVDDSVVIIKNIIGGDSRFKFSENSNNKGCGYTKRKCAELASGEICAFLDPDDAITRDALSVMVAEHMKHPEASMVYSNLIYCDEFMNRKHENKSRKINNGDPFFFDFDGSISAFLSYKKKFYDRTGGIDGYLQRAVDRDLALKLYEEGPAIFLDKGFYLYRIHGGGISTNTNKDKAYFWFWVVIIDAARRRKINIENLFVEKALVSRKEWALQKEIDGYNKSVLFKVLRKLGLFKI